MSMVLPKEINYATPASLPQCDSKEIVLSPVNGGTFGSAASTGSNLIQWDFPQSGFLDPNSLYIRYRVKTTGVATNVHSCKKLPVYTLLQRLEVLFGSQIVENINDYNVYANMWMDMQLDPAQRYGSANQYGLSASGSLADTDGGASTIAASTTSFTNNYAAPLPCLLSSSDRLIPLGLMPNVRLQITTETVANAFLATTPPTGIEFSNIELVYTSIHFGAEVENVIKGVDSFFIKSQSVASMSNNLSTAITGTADLVYNLRLASVKSLFCTFAPTGNANAINQKFDSYDLTNNNGSFVFNVAGVNYPQRDISTLLHKNSLLLEIQKACGGLHSESYNSSISPIEWGMVDGGTSTFQQPGKFYFAQNLEKIVTNQTLLSGISTQSSPIVLRIVTNHTTTSPYNITMFALYDALIQINPLTRDASVKQ